MPAKAAPKVEKAMDKPPAAATRSHDAYPGEHLGSRSDSSRQRAADFVDGSEGDSKAKATDSKAAKSKPPKQAAGNDQIKPSKVDGHPVETEKTHPGGDMVEVEPNERDKPGKSKETKKTKGKGRGSKPGKAGNEVSESADQDAAIEVSASSKPKKTKKGVKTGDPKVDSTKAKAKAKKFESKNVDLDGGEVDVTAENVEVSAPEPAKKATKPKKAMRGADEEVENVEAHPTKDAAATAPSKAAVEKGSSKDAGIDDASDTAMDQSVFDSLLSTDKGKQPVGGEVAPEANAKPPKAVKKVAQDDAKGVTSSKANTKVSKKSKDIDKSDADREAPASRSKKRKSPANGDVTDVKTDLLDPLSEIASVKKKQKKSRSGSSALEVASDTVGSLLSSVKQTAKTTIDVAGNVASKMQSSIMGDVTAVAEGVVEEKGKKKKKRPQAVEDSFPSEESLLKGMESSGDEKDPAEDDGFEKGELPPPVPESTLNKINELSTPDAGQKSDEGVIYVGRIPHGFYEHEMRAYFSQFGHITRLRLSRNKTTGASRHYAFIEFDSKEVANIVAETMNNYLLFGHILKVKSLDASRIDPKIWKGANRRFKKVPWAQIEGRKLAMPMSREQWEKRVEREQTRREKKAEKMKEIGYEFESSLKNVDQVPVKDGKKEIDEDVGGAVVEEEQTLVTEPGEEGSSLMIKESTFTKKVRKPSAKAKEIESSKEANTAPVKKGKRKADAVLDKAKESMDTAEPVPKKVKKAKAKGDEITNEANKTSKDHSAFTGGKAKKAGEKASKKAKELLDKAGPVIEKAEKKAQETYAEPEKTTEEYITMTAEKSKNASEEATVSAASIAYKGKEAANVASETVAAVTGKPKKRKKTKA